MHIQSAVIPWFFLAKYKLLLYYKCLLFFNHGENNSRKKKKPFLRLLATTRKKKQIFENILPQTVLYIASHNALIYFISRRTVLAFKSPKRRLRRGQRPVVINCYRVKSNKEKIKLTLAEKRRSDRRREWCRVVYDL